MSKINGIYAASMSIINKDLTLDVIKTIRLNYNIPITLGIISADNLKLAQVRSQDIKADETHPNIKQPVNYGQSAAKALLDMFLLDL